MVKKTKSKITPGKVFDCFNGLIMLLLVIIMLYPFWYLIVGSLSSTAHIYSGKFLIWPDGFHTESYKAMLGNPKVGMAFLNSLFVTIVGTALSMLLIWEPMYCPSLTFPEEAS